MQLEKFNNDGIEIIIDTTTGEAFATQRGYCRMSGVPRSTVYDRLKTLNKDGRLDGFKIAKTVQVEGFDGGRITLIPASIVFQWAVKDNPELAMKMGEVGATIFLHQLAGYKVIPTAVQPLDNTQEMLSKMMEMMQQISEENKQIVADNKQMKQDIAELKETKMKYDNIQTNVSFRFDNLFLTLRQYEYEELTQKLLESAQGTPFTVKEWLDGKRISLDRGTKTKFGRLVADSYKAMVGREPDTKGNTATRLYFDKDKDLLQMCFRQLMNN